MVPPHVEYSLTADGQQLGRLLAPLMEWISANAEQAVGERSDAVTAS